MAKGKSRENLFDSLKTQKRLVLPLVEMEIRVVRKIKEAAKFVEGMFFDPVPERGIKDNPQRK